MVHVPVSYRWLGALERAKKAGISMAVCGGGLLTANVAVAHIELSEPIARYEVQGETGIKGCPCGMATGGGGSNRTCKVAMDGSDANRNEGRAFTAAAGSTVVLKFKETVGHTGKYRVAFDPEGADFNDFNDNVLTEVDDPSGSTGNVQNGNNWEIEVTLPETPCANCTLQLIQVMDPSTLGASVDGTKLANMSTYYACIDLVLTGEEGSTAGAGSESVEVSTGDVGSLASTEVVVSSAEASTSADVAPTNPAPTNPAAPPVVTPPPSPTPSAIPTPPPQVNPVTPAPTPSDAAPATSTAAPTSSTTGSTTDGPAAPGGSSADAGGCAIAAVGGPSTNAAWTLLGLVFGLGWRRRRDS